MTAQSGNRSSPSPSRAQRPRSSLGSKDEGALIVGDEGVASEEGRVPGEGFEALPMGVQQRLGALFWKAAGMDDEMKQGDELLFRLVFAASQG